MCETVYQYNHLVGEIQTNVHKRDVMYISVRMLLPSRNHNRNLRGGGTCGFVLFWIPGVFGECLLSKYLGKYGPECDKKSHKTVRGLILHSKN